MSYKAKSKASTEAGEYRGGAVTANTPPKRLRYPCFAHDCQMPGTIFPSGGQDGTAGTCAWHYGVKPSDIPRVTAALRDWGCVAYEVNEARRALTGEIASDPVALEEAFRNAWERLEPLSGEWTDRLRPSTIRDTPHRENYSDWAKRLNKFLGSRVAEALSTHRERRAA